MTYLSQVGLIVLYDIFKAGWVDRFISHI